MAATIGTWVLVFIDDLIVDKSISMYCKVYEAILSVQPNAKKLIHIAGG